VFCGVFTSPITITFLRLSSKFPDILNYFNQIWSFSIDFLKSPGYKIWWKSVRLEPRWCMMMYTLALFATMRKRIKRNQTQLYFAVRERHSNCTFRPVTWSSWDMLQESSPYDRCNYQRVFFNLRSLPCTWVCINWSVIIHFNMCNYSLNCNNVN